MAATKHRDLAWLKTRIGENPGLKRHWRRLARIAELVESECPDDVSWVVAYGPAVGRLDNGTVSRVASSSLKILAVTTRPSFYEGTMELAEKVFGPVLTEFGVYTDLIIWTQADTKAAAKQGGPLWDSLTNGIWLYGSPRTE